MIEQECWMELVSQGASIKTRCKIFLDWSNKTNRHGTSAGHDGYLGI